MNLGDAGLIKSMMGEIKDFDPHRIASYNKHLNPKTRKARNINHLFSRYTFPGTMKNYPGVDNFCSKLQYRISVWQEAHFVAGTRFTDQEYDFIHIVQGFVQAYSSGLHENVGAPKPRALTEQEVDSLRAENLRELCIWIQYQKNTILLTRDQDVQASMMLGYVEYARRKLREKGCVCPE